jgi:hypothetical protein
VNCIAASFFACFPRALVLAFAALMMVTIDPAGERAMAADSSSAIGWIEILPVSGRDNHITIRGQILALKPVEGKFGLRVKRTSRGNTSDNKQGGQFSAQVGESRVLSTTTINLQPNDHLEIVLTLSVDGAEVFSATLRSP